MNISLSEFLAEFLVKKEIVPCEEKELYAFGINYMLATVLNIATTAVIGLAIGMLWESAVFFAGYMPLRIYAGGYHAKTQVRCYFISIGMTLAALALIRFVPWSPDLCAGLLAATGCAILLFAPAAAENKPLDQAERRVYRRRAITVFALESGLILCLLLAGLLHAAVCMAVAVGMEALMLVLAVYLIRTA